MSIRITSFLAAVILSCTAVFAQTTWHDPLASDVSCVSGRGWSVESANTFNRLPERFRQSVRPALWNLSTNSSGLYIEMATTATEITVKYTVTEPKWLNNVGMMAKSGVDIYRRNNDASWQFCACFEGFNFGEQTSDTITYHYSGLTPENEGTTVYRLYLLLYNKVSSLVVGVPSGEKLQFLPADSRRPIVVYGTSVA